MPCWHCNCVDSTHSRHFDTVRAQLDIQCASDLQVGVLTRYKGQTDVRAHTWWLLQFNSWLTGTMVYTVLPTLCVCENLYFPQKYAGSFLVDDHVCVHHTNFMAPMCWCTACELGSLATLSNTLLASQLPQQLTSHSKLLHSHIRADMASRTATTTAMTPAATPEEMAQQLASLQNEVATKSHFATSRQW
jgi:hypothetical protein